MGLFALATLIFTTACKDEAVDTELNVKRSLELDIPVGDSTQVTITSGNGDYVIASTATGIVETRLEENTVWMKALKTGRTFLWITDSKGKSFYVRVTVVSLTASDRTPAFTYDGESLGIGEPCIALSVSEGRIAVTDVNAKTQYLLAWNGDLSSGNKTDGVMRIVKAGQPVASYALTTLNLQAGGDYNIVSFTANGKDGTAVFTKQ